MFDFYYNYIKPKYGEKAELLFTDADSLMCCIQTDDFYKDIAKDIKRILIQVITLKNIRQELSQELTKKVIGKFKDEAAGKQITHFVGLRPKLYSFKLADKEELKKLKGIKKNVIKKEISFDDYKRCLFSGEEQMRTMNIIKSEHHEIYSMKMNNIGLSANDDKRQILADKVHTLALR